MKTTTRPATTTSAAIRTRLAQILDPTPRIGDAAAPDGHEGWSTIQAITGTTATLEVLTERTITTRDVPLDSLRFLSGSTHLSRRPGHPHCIDPDCPARSNRDHRGWIVITGWPDARARAARQNWRWVQACPAHRDLAEAYIADWIGPRGQVARTNSAGHAVAGPTLSASFLHARVVTHAEQDPLFTL